MYYYASCRLFADDTKLLKSVVTSNDCTQLQLDLTSLEQWCSTWRLNLNQHKCTHLRLSLSNQAKSPQTVAYKVCGTTLESVTSQRDLGVIVTNNLSWSLHYGKLCQKAYNALHLIKRSLPESVPVYLKKQLYIFRTTCTRTGSTGRMLNINYTRTSAARHFYFNRIVLLWNSVQPAINLNESFKVVRYKLINFLWSHFIYHFNPLDTCTYHLVCPCSNCHATGRSTLLTISML